MQCVLPQAGYDVAEEREQEQEEEEAFEACSDLECLLQELDEFALLLYDLEHFEESAGEFVALTVKF